MDSIISTISFSDNPDELPLVCRSTTSATLAQILQQSGFTEEDLKNISLIIDKNSKILHSASGSLFLSHQAISEGYFTQYSTSIFIKLYGSDIYFIWKY